MSFTLDETKHYRAEAFDLWHYYSWHRYDSCIRMRIDFGGRLDEAALAKALEQSCVTLPLIACEFDVTPLLRPRWVARAGAEREILHVVEAPGRREEEVQCAFATSLDIYRGPQLRVVLVRGTRCDSLCLIINHMLCDGFGFKQYLVVLASLYSRATEGLDLLPPPFCTDRSVRPILKGLTWKKRLRAMLSLHKLGTKAEIESDRITGLAFESGPFSTLTASVPEEIFRHARRVAKAQGFTVNDLFLATFSLAWSHEFNVRMMTIPCTMDLRRFASPEVPMGITNFSSGCLCFIQISPDDTMKSVMAQFARQMEAYKQKALSLPQLVQWNIVSRLLPSRWLGWLFLRVLGSRPITLSNGGVIDENCVRFGNVSVQSAQVAGAALPSPSLVFGTSTFRDKLTFLLSIRGDEAAKERIQNVLTAMTEELADFASRYPVENVL
jgi:NRPS condensation-like uncharacterized protein